MSNKNARFWAERSKALPYNTKATGKWGKQAQWIHGEGPYASLAYCPSSGMSSCLTIQLFDTLEHCVRSQYNLMCGGKCKDATSNTPNATEWHQIWDLSERGFKRLDKTELIALFITNPLSAEEASAILALQDDSLDSKSGSIQ